MCFIENQDKNVLWATYTYFFNIWDWNAFIFRKQKHTATIYKIIRK